MLFKISDIIVREYEPDCEVELDVQFTVYPGEDASSDGPGEDAYIEVLATHVIWGSVLLGNGKSAWLMHPINIELTEDEKGALLVDASEKIADHYRAQEEDAYNDR